VNSCSGYQTAPTCLIDPDGEVIEIAPPEKKNLLTFEYVRSGSNFAGMAGIQHSEELLGMD